MFKDIKEIKYRNLKIWLADLIKRKLLSNIRLS